MSDVDNNETEAPTLEEAREAAVAKFPGAAPLADLIVGNTVQEVEAMAEELQRRLSPDEARAVADAEAHDAEMAKQPAMPSGFLGEDIVLKPDWKPAEADAYGRPATVDDQMSAFVRAMAEAKPKDAA